MARDLFSGDLFGSAGGGSRNSLLNRQGSNSLLKRRRPRSGSVGSPPHIGVLAPFQIGEDFRRPTDRPGGLPIGIEATGGTLSDDEGFRPPEAPPLVAPPPVIMPQVAQTPEQQLTSQLVAAGVPQNSVAAVLQLFRSFGGLS